MNLVCSACGRKSPSPFCKICWDLKDDMDHLFTIEDEIDSLKKRVEDVWKHGDLSDTAMYYILHNDAGHHGAWTGAEDDEEETL